MRYIKSYEELNNEPQIGDYVYCYLEDHTVNDFLNFINSSIGKLIDVRYNYDNTSSYAIMYENIPKNIKFWFDNNIFSFENNMEEPGLASIKFWAKNKEDLEDMLAADKYNL
jgi:hypothetical protein